MRVMLAGEERGRASQRVQDEERRGEEEERRKGKQRRGRKGRAWRQGRGGTACAYQRTRRGGEERRQGRRRRGAEASADIEKAIVDHKLGIDHRANGFLNSRNAGEHSALSLPFPFLFPFL